jgi:hypothetical protein
MPSQGLGIVHVRFEEDDINIADVLYIPDLQANLLSVEQLTEKDITCLFGSQGVQLRYAGKSLAYTKRIGRNYTLYPRGAYEALIASGQNG